jgi:lipoate-protein ligase A
MNGGSRYKVPQGKLLEMRIDYDSKIRKVEMLGDFFLYPEESITEIEKAIVGIGVDESEEKIAERIRRLESSEGIEMIGITPEAIARAVKMAVER